jgi:hypothetical protein
MQYDDDSPSPARSTRIIGWLAKAVEAAAVIAQLVIIYVLIDSRHAAGCGEQCAWSGMGLVAMLSAMLPLMLVGTVIALFFTFRARRAYRLDEASPMPYALHATIVTLPVFVFGALVLADRPLPAAQPTVATAPVETRSDQYVAGAAYATDEGIIDAAGCAGHSDAFVAGCTRVAQRQRQATSPSGAAIRGMTAR